MQTRDAEDELRRYLAERGVVLLGSRPNETFDLLLNFYRDVRVVDVELAGDGDMMIFQWGTRGARFELDLTRQLICSVGAEDEVWQLSLTYDYDAAGIELAAGASEWLADPADVDSLRSFITLSTSLASVAERRPTAVRLRFGPS